MWNDTQKSIIDYIKQVDRPVTPNELFEKLKKSRVTIQANLKILLKEGFMQKQGASPRVFYVFANQEKDTTETHEDFFENPENKNLKDLIEENFLLLTSDGQEILGIKGFIVWCKERNYDVVIKATEYKKYFDEYYSFKINGLIDATSKIKSSFNTDKTYLDNLYYLYPYSFPVFGKTKIAEWLFHAKQTQNKKLMERIFDIILSEIKRIILDKKPEAISFVPPTVPREVQFMKELEKRLNLNLPIIKIEKIKTPILIQQKSLKEISDRVKNAENTMVVRSENMNYKKVLIIDDFTGSGSTLNVLAGKMKRQKIAQGVMGLTITGSMKGFDVIREV